jgi:hypothetical protein
MRSKTIAPMIAAPCAAPPTPEALGESWAFSGLARLPRGNVRAAPSGPLGALFEAPGLLVVDRLVVPSAARASRTERRGGTHSRLVSWPRRNALTHPIGELQVGPKSNALARRAGSSVSTMAKSRSARRPVRGRGLQVRPPRGIGYPSFGYACSRQASRNELAAFDLAHSQTNLTARPPAALPETGSFATRKRCSF